MLLGIKRLTLCLNRFTLVGCQDVGQLLAYQLETFQQAFGVGIFFSRFDGTVHIVANRQEISHQWQ